MGNGFLGLSYGTSDRTVVTMKETIDNAGRSVIPLSIKLERRGRLLIAVPRKSIAPLKTEAVEQIRRGEKGDKSNIPLSLLPWSAT
jgi:hypothetical protein